MLVADRTPPHDLDAEAVILSACFLSRDDFALVSDKLHAEHFYSEANRRIYEGMVSLSGRSQIPDVVAIAGWLRDEGRLAQIGGAAYLAQLVDSVPAMASVEQHAERVTALWRLRQLIATAHRIAAEGYGVRGDTVDAFLDAAEAQIYSLANTTERSSVAHISEVVRESYESMLAAETRKDVELPTGLRLLDDALGGLGRGRLTIVAGRPGMGKTSLATGAAFNIALLGMPVAIFSLEMPRRQLGLRMACCRSGASVHRALNGWLTGERRSALLRAKEELARLPIWIDDTPAVSLTQLRAKCRLATAKAGAKLALVVVDYLQLMTGSTSARSREREVAEITGGAKRLAKELDCSVLLLSQLNRDCEREKDKRPRLADLRESGAIEQDADDVVFVFRQAAYEETTENLHDAELIIAKQRNGPIGTVNVRFDGPSTAFTDLP